MSTKYHFTILFTTPKELKIGSAIIRWRLKTKYSHCCAVIGTGPIGLFDVYEAMLDGVRDIDLTNFLKKNKVIKSCRVSFENREDFIKMIRYLKKQRGKEYSFWGAVASTFPFLIKLGIGKDGDAEFMCSEYMARALEQTEQFDFIKYRKITEYVDPKYFEQELIDAGFNLINGFHLPEYKGDS